MTHLTERISFEVSAGIPDGGGGEVRGWQAHPSLASVRAGVSQGAVKESLVADRMAAVALVTFTIRARSGLDPRMRIIWQGVPYNIRGIHPAASRRRNMEIVAERGVAS